MTDMTEIGRRAVACGDWRWLPGMLTTDGWRVSHNGDQLVGISHDYKRNEWCDLGLDGRLPDFNDPATVGCLTALVREKHGDPHAHIVSVSDFDGDFWFVARTDCWTMLEQNITGRYHSAEAEALVAALGTAQSRR